MILKSIFFPHLNGLSPAPHFGDHWGEGSQTIPLYLAPTGPFPMFPLPSPPDAAPHKATLSASSSPLVWLLSLPGACPVSLCSTRTLFLSLSQGRGSKPPAAPSRLMGTPLAVPWSRGDGQGPHPSCPGIHPCPGDPLSCCQSWHGFTSCFSFPMPADLCRLGFIRRAPPKSHVA